MFLALASASLLLAVCPWSAAAQDPPPPAAGNAAAPSIHLVSPTLRPALAQISQAIATLNIHHWKAPNEVRDAAEQDVASIQRDLSGTLAGLLDQANSVPDSIPAAFAVYRNVDALYDTLLRVVLTANLAAPENEAGSLGSALAQLENARSDLGASILGAAQTQQAEYVRLRNVIAAAAVAAREQRVPAKTTVIDDGPAKRTEVRHHHPAPHKPEKPADSTKANPNPQ